MTAQIDVSDARELVSNPGFYLDDDAALAWDRTVAAFGKDVLLTGAWRSVATQERLFRERYEIGAYSPYGDYRSWLGKTWGRVRDAAAAIPGTSNHGSGRAVDVKTSRSKGDPPYSEAVVFTSFSDPDRLRFLRLGRENGWADDEGRQVGELWHLTWYPARDQHRGEGPRAILERGTKKAADVRTLQAFLNTVVVVDGRRLVVDGQYGAATEAAVRRYQRKAGLTATGKVDVRTRARLIESGIVW